jgi:hypothetical protein
MIEVKGYDTNVVIETPTEIVAPTVINTELVPIASRSTLGYTNPEGTVQIIGILKNASTYTQTEALRQGWTFETIPFKTQIARVLLLRDPYERYLSGLAEDIDRYLSINNEKQKFFQNLLDNDFFFDFFDFLFDTKNFIIEDHTQLQTQAIKRIIHEVGINNLVWIKITDRLGDNLNLFLQGENCKSDFSNEKINQKTRSDRLLMIRNVIESYFFDGKNKKRKDNLLEYLQPDYKLINSVNFFNRC